MTDPPGSAADIMALLNSNADEIIESGNEAVATQFADIANGNALGGSGLTGPVYQSLFSEPISQVNGGAVGNLLFDVTLMDHFNSVMQPQVGQFQERFNVTAPSHPMPRDFSTGSSSQSSGYPGSYGSPPNPYQIYGPYGSASFTPNPSSGNAQGYFNVYTPANGTLPIESLFGSGTFNTNSGTNGVPRTALNFGWLRQFQSGDKDTLTANLILDGSNLTGNFTVGKIRGPLSLSGGIIFTNSVVTSADTHIDYVTPEEQFHLTYRYNTSFGDGPHRELYMSYVNQSADNVALMSNFAYNSSFGTKSAAGIKYWNNERDYLESIVTHTKPLTGAEHTAAQFRGAMKSRFSPEHSFIFNYALVNVFGDN